MIAVSSNDWLIRIYDMTTLNYSLFSGNKHNIPGIDFSCDGEFLVSCSIDGSCRIWNVETGDLIAGDIISNQWHWTAQFVQIEHVQNVEDISAFLVMGIRNSFQDSTFDNEDFLTVSSTESWQSDRSFESLKYYDCMEDPKFISKQLILSSNITSIFLSEQCGQNLELRACLENVSDVVHHHYRDLRRISIIKWIKELSAAIIVSQAGRVGLLRIVK